MPVTLPSQVINAMAARDVRLHHYLWHQTRNGWSFYDAATKNALKNLGWNPPRPGTKATPSGSAPILDNYSGEDFLYMHRQMIAFVNGILTAVGQVNYPKVEGWDPIPSPGNVDWPVPSPYIPEPADNDLEEFLKRVKSDSFWQDTMQKWALDLTNNQKLGAMSLGELGARIEFTIHNNMHMRWCSDPGPNRPDVDPDKPGDINTQWDNPTYDWLGDTYSSHVHPIFWKLHGWVDARIEQWRQAHGGIEIVWTGTWLGPMPEHPMPNTLHAMLTEEPLRMGGMEMGHRNSMKKALKIVLASGHFHHPYDAFDLSEL